MVSVDPFYEAVWSANFFFFFVILKGHHHERSIKPLSASKQHLEEHRPACVARSCKTSSLRYNWKTPDIGLASYSKSLYTLLYGSVGAIHPSSVVSIAQ